MIEARVVCVCAEYRLPDLGVVLHKGDVRWFAEVPAKGSADLRVAQRAGAVQVQWAERCTLARSPLPAFVRRPTRPKTLTVPVRHPEVAPTTPDVAESLRGMVQSEIREALRGHAGIGQEEVVSAIRTALADITLSGGSTAAHRTRMAHDDVPVFIPTNIVSADTKAAISIKAETSDSGGVDDAVNALKAARGRKKGAA